MIDVDRVTGFPECDERLFISLTAKRSAASGAGSPNRQTKPMRADWRLHRGVSWSP